MHPFSSLASLALLLASRLALVHASVYVTNPVQSSTLTGGQSYTASWVDNGVTPLLSDIGACSVAIYTNNLVLVQSLPSVDVSTTSSLSFTVDPSAGSDGQYYLVFTAENINYQGFSATFSLAGMSGTTPSGGSSIPVSTPATTSGGSSISPGSSTPTATATGSNVSTLSGTSSPTTGTTTPTDSTSVVDTATATATTSPTPTTPTVSITTSSATHTSSSTTTTPNTSASASASATNAAVRVGSSTSLGGAAALLVLSGVLAF